MSDAPPAWFVQRWQRSAVVARHLGRHNFTAGQTVDRRGHPDYNLVLVEAGSGELLAADRRLPFTAGDCWLVPPRHPVRECYSSACRTVIGNFDIAAGDWDPLTGLGLPARVGLGELPDSVTVLLAEALGPADSDPFASSCGLALRSVLDRFLQRAWQVQAFPTPVSAPVPDWLRQALDLVGRRYPRADLRLGHVAALVGVSPSRLSHGFRRHMGQAPMAWVQHYRLERAAELLRREPARTAAELAERCGFADYRHFARLFRRRFACSPSQWRDHTARSDHPSAD